MRLPLVLFGSLAFGALAASPASAQAPSGEPETISHDVRDRISERWNVDPSRIRLSWQAGRAPTAGEDSVMELLGSGRGGYWVVRLRASDGSTGSMRLRSGVVVSQPIATRPIDRGTAVRPDHFVMRDTVVWGPAAAEGLASPVGWVAHRRIAVGETLTSPGVQPPLAVERGGPVAILWSQGSIAVRLVGTAAGSGVVGDRIRVVTESGTRLRGTIVAPRTVRLVSDDHRETGGRP